MTTPQTPRARRSPLARYAPALAVVVVIAIIALVIGLFSGGKKSKHEVTTNTTPRGFADVPILYNEAKAAGTLAKYTWPANCDTTTGLIKLPVLTPPPCVPVVFSSAFSGSSSRTGLLWSATAGAGLPRRSSSLPDVMACLRNGCSLHRSRWAVKPD